MDLYSAIRFAGFLCPPYRPALSLLMRRCLRSARESFLLGAREEVVLLLEPLDVALLAAAALLWDDSAGNLWDQPPVPSRKLLRAVWLESVCFD